MDLEAGLKKFFALRLQLHSFAMRFSRDGRVDIRIRRAPLHGIIRQQDAHNIRRRRVRRSHRRRFECIRVHSFRRRGHRRG